jgi:predicted NBD/HSP70 family sugar kinase
MEMKKLDRLKTLYHKVWEQDSLTKTELAEKTALSLTAVSEYINELAASDWIIPRKKAVSSGGRRPIIYQINPEVKYIIGIDLKDSHFYIFLADLNGGIIKSELIYLKSCEFDDYSQRLITAVKKLLQEEKLKSSDILSIGISVSGVTDFANKIINRSNQLDWTDVPLAQVLEDNLQIQTFIAQDVRVYAYNELEADDPYNITTVLFIGEGIGLSVIINNKILKGATNRVGDNRFFEPQLQKLNRIIRTDQYLKEINSLPYYEGYFDKSVKEELNHKYRDFINQNQKNKAEINEFTNHIASMMLSTINLLNPKKVLLTGNIFDYNDLIYNQVKEKITAGEMYHLPQIKRSKSRPNPLENALLKFLIHKFLKLDSFSFDQ